MRLFFSSFGITPDTIMERSEFSALYSATPDGGVLDLGGKTVIMTSNYFPMSKNITIQNGGFKRADTPTALTTSDTNIGDYSFPVDDASGFTAGQQIQIIYGQSVGEHAAIVGSARIQSVSSNTINTYSNQYASKFAASGSVLCTIYPMFQLTEGYDIIFDNIIFDGNKENNSYTYDWSLQSIGKFGQGHVIKNSIIKNTPCESLIIRQGAKITDNYFNNLNGSAFHVSNVLNATIETEILRNSGDGICQQPMSVNGHNEGVLTFSAKAQWIKFEYNNFKNGLEGCYGVQTLDDYNINVRYNTWENFGSKQAGLSEGHTDPIDYSLDTFTNV